MALSYAAFFVMHALARGHKYGFDVMDATGLPSGTVYPALRRLEALGLIASSWEDDAEAREAGRPKRRYYKLTGPGRRELAQAETRYRAVSRLLPKPSRT